MASTNWWWCSDLSGLSGETPHSFLGIRRISQSKLHSRYYMGSQATRNACCTLVYSYSTQHRPRLTDRYLLYMLHAGLLFPAQTETDRPLLVVHAACSSTQRTVFTNLHPCSPSCSTQSCENIQSSLGLFCDIFDIFSEVWQTVQLGTYKFTMRWGLTCTLIPLSIITGS